MKPQGTTIKALAVLSACHFRFSCGFSVEPIVSRIPTILLSSSTDSTVLTGVCHHISIVTPHTPSLGLTVEESLADASVIFVAGIVNDGPAHVSGMLVGDVLTSVADMFGTLQCVQGLGIDKVKNWIACRNPNEPLNLSILRGTTVLEQHEAKLVDLCTNGGNMDSELEECLLDYLKLGYDNDRESLQVVDDDTTECMLDQLSSLWANDDMIVASPQPLNMTDANRNLTPKPKPWSARSSPSGTYVRDPVTRQMKRID